MQQTANKKTGVHPPRMATAAFGRLCDLMDQTDFTRHPYRGVLKKVLKRTDYKDVSSISLAIKKFRRPEIMVMVADEIRRVNRGLEKSAKVLNDMEAVA